MICLPYFQIDDDANVPKDLWFLVTEPNAGRNLAATPTANSLVVTWDEPTSGSVTEYTVEIKDTVGTKQTIADGSTKTATFNGLAPSTGYTIVLISIAGDVTNGGQSSNSVESTFNTSKLE